MGKTWVMYKNNNKSNNRFLFTIRFHLRAINPYHVLGDYTLLKLTPRLPGASELFF